MTGDDRADGSDGTDETPEVEVVDPGGPQLPDLSALLGGGGLPDLGGMMDSLAKVQAVQDEVYEGSAGGGLVRITATGRLDVESVAIDPAALDDGDAELLADLVLAALRDLTARITAAQQEAMGPLGGMLG